MAYKTSLSSFMFIPFKKNLVLLFVACSSWTAYAQTGRPMTLAPKAPTDGVQLYGTVFNSFGTYAEITEENQGLYTLNTSDPSKVSLVKAGLNSYGGGTYAQGIYYSAYYKEDESGQYITMPIKLWPYKFDTWTADTVYRGFALTSVANDLAFDPVTQQIYGIFADDNNVCRTLGRVHFGPANEMWGQLFSRDLIGELPEKMVALTASLQGQLYGIGQSGTFYTIDKYTAQATAVGHTGITPKPLKQSATIDYATGTVYWAAVIDNDGYWDSSIYAIDPTTGKATIAADLADRDGGTCRGEQFLGLFIKQDPKLSVLPQAVTGLTASATSQTQVHVNFTLPVKDVADNAISGNLCYAVRCNGAIMAEGTGTPGQDIVLDITPASNGATTLLVTAAVPATDESPEAVSEPDTAQLWIGYGIPLSPTDLTMTEDGDNVTLAWTAPTACVNNGLFDADGLFYTVTRYQTGTNADTVVVKDSLKATSFTDTTLPKTTGNYYYTVVAHNGSFTSEPATTDILKRVGTLPLPYSNAFNSESSTEGFTFIDANADGSTWHYDDSQSMLAYQYNNQKAADDWVITPGIAMKKGAIYSFSFEALNSYPTERIEARIGTAATAAAMTDVVIAPTDIEYMPRVHTLNGTFRAPADGTYYFGIHAISDADMNTLYMRNLNISESALIAPEPVSDFNVTPAAQGSNEATITFTAPTLNLDSTAIEGTMSVRLTRDSQPIDTLENVTPGQPCTFTDQQVSSGNHTYAAIVVTDKGESVETEQTVYVGLDTPGSVLDLRAVEDLDHPGLIHVTWRAPEKGANGGYVDPEGLTYYLSRGYESEDRNLGSNTSFDDQLDISDYQTFTGYTVYAVNATGSGRNHRQTCTAIAGPALTAPMVESFPNCTMKSGPWLTNVTNGEIGDAYCYATSEYEPVKAQDADGGMQSFSAIATGLSVRSESPKVDISGLTKPTLTFWALFNGAADSLIVSVSPDYKGFAPVLRLCADQVEKGWQRYSVDLSAYKSSRFVQVGFEGKCMSELNNFIDYDNVAIIEQADYDLMARSLTGPERASTGSNVSLQFTFRNNSADPVDAANYQVNLYKNGQLVSTVQGQDLAADATATLILTDKAGVFDADITSYTASVQLEDDEVTENDSSNSVQVVIDKPDYPSPAALTASKTGSSVTLQWTEPDLINRPAKATTDNFDAYTAFAINDYGQWQTVDRDQQNTIMITLNAAFGPLQYDNAGKPMAFQVFNVTEAGIPLASWSPHSGEQMLVCFANASPDGGYSNGKQNDDWLISPELNATAQTIRFYAKAGMGGAYIPEQMEVLYSTTDQQPESFTKVGQTIDVTNVSGWQEYSFDVPEGARYFAIHCVSDYKFALLIDDITYIAAGSDPEPLVLQGYNVYRNQQILNDDGPVSTTTFITTADDDADRYQVTAVYDKGESMPTEATTVTGISDVAADAIAISGTAGGFSLSGAQGCSVSVYTVDGRLVATRTASTTTTFGVQPGLYVVKVNGKIFKVNVK